MTASSWEVVIGLEVHCQLLTATKLFCGCSTRFGAAPNSQTCPVCLGHPGVLPVLNAEAVRLAVRLARAVGGTLPPESVFSRKNYFYPDLPKGYQITQYERPFCEGGEVEVSLRGVRLVVPLTRIHLEEDAGKSTHGGHGLTEVDLNRAGTPLVEIVSEPALRSSDEAAAYLEELRNLVRTLGVSDGHLEEGSFRCDANVSLRRPGAPLGTRVELKNLNSFTFVKKAIDYEVARQREVLEEGGAVIQETRLWDERVTRPMRGKEDAHDYRYFPEPDLLPLRLRSEWLADALPELPGTRRRRYVDALGLSQYDAEVLTADSATSAFFEAMLAAGAGPKASANWLANELMGRLNTEGRSVSASPVAPQDLAALVVRTQDGRLSSKLAKEAFSRLWAGESAAAAIAAVGEVVSDSAALEAAIADVLGASPDEVAQFHAGKTKVVGFFVGRIMKALQGKADPQLTQALLLAALEARRPT